MDFYAEDNFVKKIIVVAVFSFFTSSCASKPIEPYSVYPPCNNKKFLQALQIDMARCEVEYEKAREPCLVRAKQHFDKIPREQTNPNEVLDFIIGCSGTEMAINVLGKEKVKESIMKLIEEHEK